jgi:A118 family predicted phage portal protein
VPLPANGTLWPPKDLAPITPRLAEWAAWFDGSPDELRGVYGANAVAGPIDRPSQRRGGVVGALARFWWGRPVNTGTATRVDQLHVPIAADLCQASADLLYAEPPAITVADETTQKRVNEYLDDGLHTVLASGAEVGAALGGRYHRVTWDRAVVRDRPFVTTIDADAAWPTFRWDRLVGVTFWHVVERTNSTVVRHLERHELDANGTGLVFHGLYVGTADDLGVLHPLTDHTATRALADAVDAFGAVVEGRTPGLLVEYIPNQRPQRRRDWRNHPIGASLGRSDLDGLEGLMDALDETYSSLMRDIRLAKGRIMVAESMLDAGKPGQGASFDLDRDVFVGLPGVLPPREGKGLPVEAQQFEIRVDEHLRTCQQLIEDILRSAGYSAQTFGEGPDGAAVTATEVQSRERRSYLTRDRKIRLERPAVVRLVQKLLSVDAAVFGTAGLKVGQPVQVAFGDSVQDSLLSLAQTAQALETARAASTRTKVKMLHPDWDEKAVDEEVALVLAEHALADPTTTVPVDAETPSGAVGRLDPAELKAAADAMGVLIRAGVKPEDAAEQVGLTGVEFTGAVPTSLRLPEADAAGLEQG